MASLLDLYNSGGTNAPWALADIGLRETQLNTEAGEQIRRIGRNFSEYDLPDLVNSQAARGAFHSSATRNKTQRLQTARDESVGDIGRNLGFSLSDLANKRVAATTGGQF